MSATGPALGSGADPRTCAPREVDFGPIGRGRVCILGIGNRERGDDAAGSLLAESLQRCSRAVAIDAGAVPENYLGKVVREDPDVILVVDAIDFGAAPGTVARVDADRLTMGGLSTHALSLAMAVEYLSRCSRAQVVVIGIQPARLGPGSGVSKAVGGALASLRQQLLKALAGEPESGESQPYTAADRRIRAESGDPEAF